MIKRKLKKSDFVAYDSIAEMVSHLATEPLGVSSGDDRDPDWMGSATYQEAVERVTKGDDKLAKMIRGFDKLDINVPVTGTRRKMMTGIGGFAPHVPNYLAGVPNNMIWCKEDKVAKKVLTCVYGTNMLADVSVSEMAKVSARVLSCIMSLERKGYRVNLYAANCAETSVKTGFTVKLKDAGQHLDPIKCAFPMLSAAWNRRFGFHFREMCGWGYAMGSSVYGEDLRQWLRANNVKFDVAFGFHDARRIKTVEELEKLFLKNINKIAK